MPNTTTAAPRAAVPPFRQWLHAWSDPPDNPAPPPADPQAPAPSHGAWVLALTRHSGVSTILRPSYYGSAAGWTDALHRQAIDALEAGTLDRDQHPSPWTRDWCEITAIAALMDSRLHRDPDRTGWHAISDRFSPPRSDDPDRPASDLLPYYWFDVIERRPELEARARIAKAALALADTLRDSGLSLEFAITDARLWEMAAGPEAVARMRALDRWPPDRTDSVILRLEPYLRAMATRQADIKQSAPNLGHPTDKNASKRLVPYLARGLRARFALDWPERAKTAHGFNELAARMLTAMLARPVTADTVAQAVKAGGLARDYWTEPD